MGCTVGCLLCTCCWANFCCCNCWATFCCCNPGFCWGNAGKVAGQIGSALTGVLGGLGGASVGPNGGAGNASSGALCGTSTQLSNTGGPNINYCLAKVDPMQLAEAPIGAAPSMNMPNPNMEISNFNMKNGGRFESGGLNSDESQTEEDNSGLPKPKSKTEKKPSILSQAVDTLAQMNSKDLNTKFVDCKGAEMLMSQMTAHPNELQSLKQIKPSITGYAQGGLSNKYEAAAPKGHNPEFITGVTGYYACGGGTGQSDDIPAMLHDGDYVMDAETVSALGDGSSKAGMHVLDGFRNKIHHSEQIGDNPVPAKIADGEYVFPASFVTALGKGDNKQGAEILDGLREKLREHKRGAPTDKIPPKAKSPLDYIKKGKE